MGYQLASIFAGSLALFDRYGSSTAISFYLAACALITVLAVALSRETVKTDLAAPHEPAHQETASSPDAMPLATERKR